MRTKMELRAFISTYKKRISEAREKYGVSSPFYRSYYIKNMTKIGNWKRSIQLIEKREREMKRIDELVEGFTGHSAKNSDGNKNKDVVLAKNLFIKYAMESGLQAATTLSLFVGLKKSSHGNRCRLEFIRTFKKHPENKEVWHRFKDFIKEYPSKQAA